MAFLTEVDCGKFTNAVYRVEDAVLPSNIMEEYAPLPKAVPLDKVLTNIVNNIDFEKIGTASQQKIWTRHFNSRPSLALMSDAFWYCICWYFKSGQHTDMEQVLFNRIAMNYVALFTALPVAKDFFFKCYADAITQVILYSMFLAYPKSRVHFNHKFRHDLLVRISYWIMGVKPEFVSMAHWKLNLGGGDVLQATAETAPLCDVNDYVKSRAPRPMKSLGTSPLVEHYIRTKKFTSQNSIRPVKMALTTAETRAQLMDAKHALLLSRAETCKQNSLALMQEYEESSGELKRQENVKASQTRLAKKRLEIRRKEVLRGDPHEYANYLVSLNLLQPHP